MRKLTLIVVFFLCWHICSAQNLALKVQWNNVTMVSKSTATLQVVSNPMLSRAGTMHDGAFNALKDIGADYVRYVPWHVYPKLVVAELEAPTATTTLWDFSLIDPMTIDFLNATKGHSVIFMACAFFISYSPATGMFRAVSNELPRIIELMVS
jgi:hypothetical protein